jgi:hypothetical protein
MSVCVIISGSERRHTRRSVFRHTQQSWQPEEEMMWQSLDPLRSPHHRAVVRFCFVFSHRLLPAFGVRPRFGSEPVGTRKSQDRVLKQSATLCLINSADPSHLSARNICPNYPEPPLCSRRPIQARLMRDSPACGPAHFFRPQSVTSGRVVSPMPTSALLP